MLPGLLGILRGSAFFRVRMSTVRYMMPLSGFWLTDDEGLLIWWVATEFCSYLMMNPGMAIFASGDWMYLA